MQPFLGLLFLPDTDYPKAPGSTGPPACVADDLEPDPGCSNPVPATPFFSSVRSHETCDHKMDGGPTNTGIQQVLSICCHLILPTKAKSSTLLGPQGLFPPSGTGHRSRHKKKGEDMLTQVAHEPLPWQSHEGPGILLPLFQTLVFKGLTEVSKSPSPAPWANALSLRPPT